MNCQICKSIFPATFNINGPRRGLFATVLRWPSGGRGGAFNERAGTFAFNFPHIALVAMYRNGLGTKRVLDIAGEPRSAVNRLIAMLKDCGAFEPGRRPDTAHLVARTRAGWSKRPEKYGPPRRLFDAHQIAERKLARLRLVRSPEYVAANRAEVRRKNQLKYYSNLAESRAKCAAAALKRYHATKREPLSIIKRSARSLCSRIARVYGVRKKFRTQAHLGCTIPHARDHIQKQFKKGMTWDNYGEWNIDHIIPLCAFDLTRENELMQACNWRNLRPMWAEDNLAKSGSHGDVQLEIIAA
jgi:hypothetical protein